MAALDGLRILDLSRLLPGPFATLALADLGATVDRIEEPGGDYLRHMPPLVAPVPNEKFGATDTCGMFLSLNRNKRSAVIDLKKESGKRALLRLVNSYDVVIEQFRPGVLDRLALSKEALRKENPKLIICSITGYGQDGPDAQRAGHDLNYISRAGLLGFQGGEPPSVPGFQVADIGGALWAVIGILAALRERDRTGQGTDVDISMTEAAMGFGIMSFGHLLAKQIPKAGNESLTGALAAYSTYRTKDDRAVALGSLEPKFFSAFAHAVGLEASLDANVEGPHQPALKARVQEVFRSKTAEEWKAFAREHDCCLETVSTPEELTKDAQHVARKSFFELASPWGDLLQWRTPTADRDLAQRSPPRAGEHSREVFLEAGFSAEEIARLVEERALLE